MIGGFIEEKDVRLNEESSCEGHSHSPTTGELCRWAGHHFLTEAETTEDCSCTGLCSVRFNVVKSLEDLS